MKMAENLDTFESEVETKKRNPVPPALDAYTT